MVCRCSRCGPSFLLPTLNIMLYGILINCFFLELSSTTLSVEALTTTTTATSPNQSCSSSSSCPSSSRKREKKNYLHMVVLVHGYQGSYKEQEYLGEALLKESQSQWGDSHHYHHHEMVILQSKANTKKTTDGIINGGKRLGLEIKEWIQQQQKNRESMPSSVIPTISIIGNSLGGLFSRYALSELDFLFHNDNDDDSWTNTIIPLIFCTTSTPHLGVSQETFIKLPRWMEEHVSFMFQQPSMDDMMIVNNSTVVMDMCDSSSKNNHKFLYPLQQFQKRIAIANAYNTDFLVSVNSGAFLSSKSQSVHYNTVSPPTTAPIIPPSTRIMRKRKHVVLQVITMPQEENVEEEEVDDQTKDTDVDDLVIEEKNKSICVDALDQLGWLKIFMDTRSMLPSIFNFDTPDLVQQKPMYTSQELQNIFSRYGTLLPIAHPLNMANSRTDWYRQLTKRGQPIMDDLAELLVLDMMELSERSTTKH